MKSKDSSRKSSASASISPITESVPKFGSIFKYLEMSGFPGANGVKVGKEIGR